MIKILVHFARYFLYLQIHNMYIELECREDSRK